MPNTILVTGSSSGFGLLIARTLLSRGETVVATMRDPFGRNLPVADELRAFAGEGAGTLHVLELDVTKNDSVSSAVNTALDLEGGIDVVVNNAGIASGGLAEAFTPEQFQRIFDLNVVGVQRVNRAVLPSMRARGSGLLVCISSVMGRIVIPCSAPYTATKFALEGLVESYGYELAGTGVEVALIEPGGFLTGLSERLLTPADAERSEGYGDGATLPDRIWGGVMEALHGPDAPDPQLVADAVVEVMDAPSGQRPLRVVVDPLMGGAPATAVNEAAARAQMELRASLGL